ncbi:MAG TPA: ImmA/IrrE family metallo-endopeptidase [Chloroflexia bacterium]|nr:ImmA/IrrE family metallo-endopeptidase [Chloroflexia bacterium]
MLEDTITASIHPKADYHRVVKVALNLIEGYGLHREPQRMVDLSPLFGAIDLRFMQMPEELYGFTLDLQEKLIVGLNDELDERQTRFVAAHELGHIAMWHPNQFNHCLQGGWFYTKLEKEATAVAAYLLVPREVVAKGLLDSHRRSLVEGLAAHYKVPPQLMLVRRALLAATGY